MAEQELKFYARQGLVTVESVEGQQSRYLGREMVMVDGAPTWPASREATAMKANSPLGKKCVKLISRQRYWERALWPADEATARYCGVPFVITKYQDGEHVPACDVELKKGEGYPKSGKADTGKADTTTTSSGSSSRNKGDK